MKGYEKFEVIIEELGMEKALDELLKALNENELQENANYIANNWDIDFESEIE